MINSRRSGLSLGWQRHSKRRQARGEERGGGGWRGGGREEGGGEGDEGEEGRMGGEGVIIEWRAADRRADREARRK